MKNPVRILVVDDEPDVVEILSYNLTKSNYEVSKAYNGNDALVSAEQYIPDLIIMDVRMPGMSGIETCRMLRVNEKLRNIPVLFLTADSDEYTTLNALDAGGNHFITKPVKPSIIINLIHELIP
jgi:two-component system alkaline phosphatase synthesis response regulator PhoP